MLRGDARATLGRCSGDARVFFHVIVFAEPTRHVSLGVRHPPLCIIKARTTNGQTGETGPVRRVNAPHRAAESMANC